MEGFLEYQDSEHKCNLSDGLSQTQLVDVSYVISQVFWEDVHKWNPWTISL